MAGELPRPGRVGVDEEQIAVLDAADDVDLDYLTAVDPATFATAPDGHAGDVRLLVAARVGPVRLIDTLLAQS